MVLTETKKDDTQVNPQIDIRIDEKQISKFEMSETTILSIIIAGALIGLVFLLFSV